jgi:CDP-diacylglycerol---glycerol-3-phosphate 3-phosphatidyltransferase
VSGSLVSPATRQRVRDLATPIATALGRLGLTPNALTLIGFLGTCVAAVAAASQWWLAAGVLVLAFGIFDLFDGALARATGQASKLGAFLDSTFDRGGEGIVYLGIAAGSLANDDRIAVLAGAALAASFLVSYVRAKAESLGFAPGSGLMNVGLAPREIRLVILAAGLTGAGLITNIDVAMGAISAALGIITFLATITTVQRILHVRAQAKEG